MKKLLTLLLIGVLVSCATPEKRFSRLIKKHPHLIETKYEIVYDTVIVKVNGTKTDTIVHRSVLKDTVVIRRDQLTVRVYEKGDSVYIDGKCDTVYVEKPVEIKVPVNYYKEEKTFWEGVKAYFKTTMWLLTILVLLAMVAKFIKTQKSKR